MRISRGRKSSPYEVRCLRCDVSFPVETKVCLHCGGRTSNAGALFEMEDPAELATGAGGRSDTLSSSRTAEASTDQLRADKDAAQEECEENCMARDAAVAACSAAVALASSTQWRVEQLERGQEALQAAASRSREVAAAASRSAAAVGRDVERLTGEILNQIVPGLRQARSALADASIAASDTPPGGSQTLDADAMQDALPPPPSLPSVDDEDARELDYAAAGAADETQLGEPAPADDASAAADAGDETQDPLSPSPKKRGSEETSDSPPPKRARASQDTADSGSPPEELNF